MDAEQLWKEFSSLSPEEQQQVRDLLARLREQQTATAQPTAQQRFDWSTEPFVGMWRDRDDLPDSATWVRNVRDREWSRHRR